MLLGEVLLNISKNPTPYEILSKTVDLTTLVVEIVLKTKFYATQNYRKLTTNELELEAFLGINNTMSINKSPTIEQYLSTDAFTGSNSIGDVITRSRCKVRQSIDHFDIVLPRELANSETQSIGVHMVKLKGLSSMKQYIKSRPVKWEFKPSFKCNRKLNISMNLIFV